MGIQERKERKKRELRKLILSTAAELFRENGYEKTSMRAIADAIEYSPGTIYRYFRDKDELLYAVSERGFKLFFEYLSSILDVQDPMKRLQKLGETYISFALEFPSYYNLMFIMNDPMRSIGDKDSWQDGRRSLSVLTGIIKDCQRAGYFEDYAPEGLSLMLWGQLHGIVSLRLRNRLTMYEDHDRDVLLYDTLLLFNSALERL